MTILQVTIQTGSDDLRSGSWADFILKLNNQPLPLEFKKFTGTGGLKNNSTNQFKINVPVTFDPVNIEFFQIRHVSQETFGQTADNWNLTSVQVDIISPVNVGTGGLHRFDGSNRVFTFS